MERVSVSVDTSVLALQYQRMQRQLEKERALRKKNEDEISALKQLLKDGSHQSKQNKKSALQKRKEQEEYQYRQLTGVKSDGVPIAHAGVGVVSLEEFRRLSNYLWDNNQYKLWLLWSIGTATCLRISDLIQLKWGFFFLDGEFRERFPKVEQKTGKLNNILITDYIKESIMKYLKVTKIQPKPNDYVFPNRKQFKYDSSLSDIENEERRIKKDKRYAANLSARLKKFGNEVGLDNKTSHSMRHSFANIVLTCYQGQATIKNLEIVSALLNHYSLKTTARYCDVMNNELDAARIVVSDFLLGKTNIKELKTFKGDAE